MLKKIFFRIISSYNCLIALALLMGLTTYAQTAEKLRIDPAQGYGGKLSEYFDEVNYIPLETTKQSLFGDISQMVITDSGYVIFDQDTKSILFFSLSGKYITKIKGKEDFYPWIDYQKKDNRLAISIYEYASKKSTTKYYSLTGKELQGKQSIVSTTATTMMALGNGFFASTSSCSFNMGMVPKDSINYLLKIYKGDSLYKSFFPYNQAEDMGVCAFEGSLSITPSPEEGLLYVSPPLSYSIYKVSKDTAIKLYQMVFPMSRTFPKNMSESRDIKYIDSIRNTRWQKENIIQGIRNIFFNKNQLFFKIDAQSYSWVHGSDNTKQYNFIYDISSGRLASIERISPDEKNGFLPFCNRNINMRGLQYNEGYFYTSVSSLQLFTAKEVTAEKKPTYTPKMEKYFKAESRMSNPVIVQLKMRQ